jgi:hypothetical protein
MGIIGHEALVHWVIEKLTPWREDYPEPGQWKNNYNRPRFFSGRKILSAQSVIPNKFED